jgi:predicted ATPase/DNA-binding XRE family transcriptional regulator
MPPVAPASFADLLRQHRLASGLTQEALAERAGLSVNGIQKLERGPGHPYRDTVLRLVAALRLSPEDQVAFRGAAQPVPHRRRDDGSGQLPGEADLPDALTSFIGREPEIAEISSLLPSVRLLTLTGVGGCGKTRLALEVARVVADTYPDGVRLVELASILDATLVPQTVASAFGVRETPVQPLLATLASVLKERQLLLVLDNCEHLIEACAHLADTLLRACPGLQILATSREALGMTSEVSRRVASLATPPLDPLPSVEQLVEYAAVHLFVERANAVRSDFVVTNRNAAAVARICHRLDGIPLALELAAARVRGLSVEDLAARLDDRFRLLTGGNRTALPRQQTLKATIDWSFELLSGVERALFARLSVFAGDWTLEAAEAVCGGNGIEQEEVLDLLLHLVEKSLVGAEEDTAGTRRYRLLETLRQYGREQLLASGQAEAAYNQHAAHYLALAEQSELELFQAAWMRRLAVEQDDYRAALEWLVGRGEIDRAMRLTGVLWRFWEVRGHLREGRQRLAELLALPGASVPSLARAKVLDGSGVLALYQYDIPTARAMFKQSLALYRQHQDHGGTAWVLIHLGWLCQDTGRYKAGRRFLRESLALCQQIDERRGIARCQTILGTLALQEGDLTTARALHEKAVALNREVGDTWGTAWALNLLGIDLLELLEIGQADAQSAHAVLQESLTMWQELGELRHQAYANAHLGVVAIWQGDLLSGRARLDQSLSTFAELGDLVGIVQTFPMYAKLFAAQGHYERVVRVLGAMSAPFRPMVGIPLRSSVERHLVSARAALGPEVVSVAWSEGQAMSLDQAVAYALNQDA